MPRALRGASTLHTSRIPRGASSLASGRILYRPFAPNDIAGLQLWLKADAGLWQDSVGGTPAVSDGDVVGAWADQSGNANHATQGTTSKKPLLKLAIQNGMPVVRFDGSDDYLAFATLQPTTSTAFLVAKDSVGGTTLSRARSGVGPSWGVDAKGTPLKWRALTNDGTQQAISSTTNAGTVFQLVATLFNNASGNTEIFVNGVSEGSVAYGVPDYATEANSLVIGIFLYSNNTLTAGPWGGDTAEILVYNTALSAADRAAIEAYLNTRYAVY